MQLSLFFPEIDWSPPKVSELPNLSNAKRIAFDTEGSAPDLKKLGPGFIRGTSKCSGISIAVDGWSTYIPLYHGEDNVEDPEQAIRWVQDCLGGDSLKLGANIHYDLDALKSLGISVGGKLFDVQMVEALIDEELDGFSLEKISQRRIGEGKASKQLDQILRDAELKMDQMNQLPARFVAEYAQKDAELLLPIMDSQMKDIREWELEEALKTETELTRVLWKMHQQGVRIDVDKAERLNQQWKKKADDFLNEALRAAPIRFNPDSTKQMAVLFDELGVSYPRTQAGNPSITNDVLERAGSQHRILSLVRDYRRTNKIRRDFIEGLFLRHLVGDRVYPQWFQSRNSREGEEDDDVAGASTGRITGQRPNLTQIPIRNPELGPSVRSLVLAEEGEQYFKGDYSSQEPRLTLHYAYACKCPGAEEAIRRFRENPRTDYHQMTADLIYEKTGVLIERRPAKDINLGIVYGMGRPKLAGSLGMTLEQADEVLAAYHRGVPYVKCVSRKASELVKERGHIRTLGGRLKRFKLWQSARYGEKGLFDTREECLKYWGSAVRADSRKGLNAAVQGSAADQLKKAVILLDKELKLPLLQVYDEVGMSVGSQTETDRAVEIMEHAVELSLPVVVDYEIGNNWGMI